MKTPQGRTIELAIVASMFLLANGVEAQPPGEPVPEPAPSGLEPIAAEPPEPAAPAEPAPVAEPAPAPAPAPEEPADSGQSDHSTVVGHTAAGYLGVSSVPVGGTVGTVATPVIGVRHWTGERVGLDIGVGLGFERTSSTVEVNSAETEGPRELAMGIAAHFGLPLVMYHQRHYAFLFIPEADLGIGYAKIDPDPDFIDDELKYLGFFGQAGARVGSEVHFGFMGIPQLSLQASVGAHARYEWTQVKQTQLGQKVSDREDALSFGTTVQNSPWAIFTANVAALYYF